MSISPDLFDSILPPEMWVTLGPVEPAYSDDRTVVVRVKPFGRRSITAKETISRYSPEASVFRALSHFIAAVQSAQKPVTKDLLQDCLSAAIINYVEPF